MPLPRNPLQPSQSSTPRPGIGPHGKQEAYRADMAMLETSSQDRQRGLLTYQDQTILSADSEYPHCGHTARSVARLSTDDVSKMQADEMLEVIRVADFPILSDDDLNRLKFAQRSTLERLVFLSRECCRNRECPDGLAQRRTASGDTFKWFRTIPR